MNTIDVVLGLQYGDEGKGKITNQMARTGDYDYVLRYNGGSNAGHTIYVNGQKVVTHLVPCGIFHNLPSVIGSGCVVHVGKLLSELEYLEGLGFDTNLVKVAYNAHIVTDEHIGEDSKDTTIGTTRTGNGPCYRDKVMRVGKRAEDVQELKNRLIDASSYGDNNRILAEGAQGYWLDIDNGDYPYVTSSSCGIGAVINNGFSHKEINEVIGVAKAYSTYVGAKSYGRDPLNLNDNTEKFEAIREIGQEFGATTGRSRQIDWFDVDEVVISCLRNGVDKLIINKLDVLKQIPGAWNVYDSDVSFMKLIKFADEEEFKNHIVNQISLAIPKIKIEFQDSPL
jgi:adenylosuccinate synthase